MPKKTKKKQTKKVNKNKTIRKKIEKELTPKQKKWADKHLVIMGF